MTFATRRNLLIGTAAAVAVHPAQGRARHAPSAPMMGLGEWMKLASVPGASWAWFSASTLVARADGFAKAGIEPATPETLFEAASLSKPVLAVAVLDLAREGVISLDAPVAQHVDFARDPRTRTITPRHLLSHSGGLPNWRTEAGAELVSRFAPGTGFRYSGEGFVLLGRLVEAVTGRTAAEVVRARVLGPAGMTRSGYGWAAEEHPAVAWAHDDDGAVIPDKGPESYRVHRDAGPRRPIESWTQADREAAALALGKPPLPVFMTPNMAAGLWTTAADYARFLRFTIRYPEMGTASVAVAANLAWGLGYGLEQSGGRRFAWHWGANDGVANLFVLDLANGEGLVILTNGAGGQRVYERAARVAFAREFDALTWLQP